MTDCLLTQEGIVKPAPKHSPPWYADLNKDRFPYMFP